MSDSEIDQQTDPPIDLRVTDLGRMSYAEAFERQIEAHAEVLAAREHGATPPLMHLLTVEHDPPVITVSRRAGARANLIATDAMLDAAGVTVAETNRGGDITYHGPGQLVAYPILDLNVLGLRLHGYMRFLESAVIETLAGAGLRGERDSCATGVWLHRQRSDGGAKIAAMGVRVSRWISMHGLALNVDPNLAHFDFIVPCGLTNRPVTSMAAELGSVAPPLDRVRVTLVDVLTRMIHEHDTRRSVQPG